MRVSPFGPAKLLRALLLSALACVVLAAPALADTGGVGATGPDTGSGSGGKIEESSISGVSGVYAKFTVIVADGTGLSPRVIAAWTLAEGGPKDNPLNIGPGNEYGTVRGGARATVEHLHGDLYRKVMRTVGQSDMAQIDAIVASPWCYRCPGYKRLLRSTYRRVRIADQ